MADSAKMIAKELAMQLKALATQVGQGSPAAVHQLEGLADEAELLHGMLPTPESVGGKPYPVPPPQDEKMVSAGDAGIKPAMADPGKPPSPSSKDPSTVAKARTNIDTDVKSPTAQKQDPNDSSDGKKDVTGKPGAKR